MPLQSLEDRPLLALAGQRPDTIAAHSVVFGGFASRELANRVEAAQAKCIITASCGMLGGGRALEYKPIVDEAISMCNSKPQLCVVLQVSPDAE